MNRLFIITIFSLVCLLQIHASNINGSLQEEGIPVNIQEYKTGLQLSKKDLKEKSTEELLDICLGYPYIIDCLFYDSIEEGIDELISEFNGFPELLSRTDAVKTMGFGHLYCHSTSWRAIYILQVCCSKIMIIFL